VVQLRVAVAAVLVAVVGLLRLPVHRLCQVLLRFLVVRLRLLPQDKVVEDRSVLQRGPARAARRQWT
jgi:hypothetical protein